MTICGRSSPGNTADGIGRYENCYRLFQENNTDFIKALLRLPDTDKMKFKKTPVEISAKNDYYRRLATVGLFFKFTKNTCVKEFLWAILEI